MQQIQLSCSYCKQGALHPLPQNSDWSSKDWDGVKAKTKEQSKSLIDCSNSKPKTDTEQTMNIDKVSFDKLQIGQDDQKEEPPKVTESLVPPPPMMEESNDTAENINGKS